MPRDTPERLINLVFSCPALYDQTHSDYRNMGKKDRIWQGIGHQLGVTSEEVKKKWKNLRDCYIKYLSHEAGTAKKKKNNYDSWRWAAEMKPFKAYMIQNMNSERSYSTQTSEGKNAAADNLEESYNDIEPKIELMTYDYDSYDQDYPENIEEKQEALQTVENERCYNNEEPTIPGTSSADTNFEKHSNKRKRGVQFTERDVEHLQGNNESELDDTDLLMLSFAKTIKKLSRRKQIMAKRKISEIVLDLELEELLHDY